METKSMVPSKNFVVGVHWKVYENVFKERIWYTRAIEEIIPYKNNIRIIIFYTIFNPDENNTERKMVGCFVSPNYLGNATKEPIEKKFILTEGGSYAAVGADEDFALRFFITDRLPYLSSKSGTSIWQINDDETLNILKSVHQKHYQLDSSEANEILSVLELVIDELEKNATTDTVSPEIEEELRVLPDWLKKEVESCDTADLPVDQNFVRKLIGRSKRNPLYSLQAAAIQIKLVDYKFLLSLANYCYSQGFASFEKKEYKESAKYFLEAADLYQRDPMITDTGWKQQKRLECISKYISAHVQELLDINKYTQSSDELVAKVSPQIEKIPSPC
jgi:hypothetical protein